VNILSSKPTPIEIGEAKLYELVSRVIDDNAQHDTPSASFIADEAMREVDPEGKGPELALVGALAALLMIADEVLARRFRGKVKNSEQLPAEADALIQWRRHHLPR
jgi:hypothetical protein